MCSIDPMVLTPIVVAHAVPSEVQSTVGSDWKASPRTLCNGRFVWPHEAPPLVEKNCACAPLPAMSFEAAMIFCGSLKLIRTSDSLRGDVCAPEMRCSPLAVALLGPSGSAPG